MKKRLLGLVLDTFREARARRQELERDRAYVQEVLRKGRERAATVIGQVMAACLPRLRPRLGVRTGVRVKQGTENRQREETNATGNFASC